MDSAHQESLAIVLFDSIMADYNDTLALTQELPLEHGGDLEYFMLTGEQVFHYGPHSFGVREN